MLKVIRPGMTEIADGRTICSCTCGWFSAPVDEDSCEAEIRRHYKIHIGDPRCYKKKKLPPQKWWERMHNRGYFSLGMDREYRAFVVNWTGNYISVGATTSPSRTGYILGVILAKNGAKRQDQENGETGKEFRGRCLQFGFIFFKVYLYMYFDGDGRE